VRTDRVLVWTARATRRSLAASTRHCQLQYRCARPPSPAARARGCRARRSRWGPWRAQWRTGAPRMRALGRAGLRPPPALAAASAFVGRGGCARGRVGRGGRLPYNCCRQQSRSKLKLRAARTPTFALLLTSAPDSVAQARFSSSPPKQALKPSYCTEMG